MNHIKFIFIHSTPKTASTTLFETINSYIGICENPSEYIVIHTHDMKCGFIGDFNEDICDTRLQEKKIEFTKMKRWVEDTKRNFYYLNSDNTFLDIVKVDENIIVLSCIRDPLSRKISNCIHDYNLMNYLDAKSHLNVDILNNFFRRIFINTNNCGIPKYDIFQYMYKTRRKLDMNFIISDFKTHYCYTNEPLEYMFTFDTLKTLYSFECNLEKVKEQNYDIQTIQMQCGRNVIVCVLKMEALKHLRSVIGQIIGFEIKTLKTCRDKKKSQTYYLFGNNVDVVTKNLFEFARQNQNIVELYNSDFVKSLGYTLESQKN